MAYGVGAPTQTKAFLCVSEQFQLWIDCPCRQARMFRPVPDHNPPICTHSRNDIWVLWLISCFVYLPFVINLLYNVEFNFHWRFFGPVASISANLSPLIIVILSIRCSWVR